MIAAVAVAAGIAAQADAVELVHLANNGVRTAFRETPNSLGLRERSYPEDEPRAHKDQRLLVRDQVMETAKRIMEFTGHVNMILKVQEICQNPASVRRFNKWKQRLKALAVFNEQMIYRQRFGPNGDLRNINSGPRMTPQLMNTEPTTADFVNPHADPQRNVVNDRADILLQLVVRTLHRYLNSQVFLFYDSSRLGQQGEEDPNIRSIGGNQISKKDMSRMFLHNSQRGYWHPRACQYALRTALPSARNAVLLALTDI